MADHFVDQYLTLARGLVWPTQDTRRASLESIILDAPDEDVHMLVASEIANTSGHTLTEATAMVSEVSGKYNGLKTKPRAAAITLTQMVAPQSPANVAGFGGKVTLSGPAMLSDGVRIYAAVFLGLVVFACLPVIVLLASTSGSNWAYASVLAIGVASIIGLLVVVMGYKNVTIEGIGGPPSTK